MINFDYPNSSEDYIHRIGRTGRSDTTGTSYAFFTPSNYKQAKDLVSVLKEANQVVNPKLAEIAGRFGNSFGGGRNRWGYGSFRGRENTRPRSHMRYDGSNGGGNRFRNNGYSNDN